MPMADEFREDGVRAFGDFGPRVGPVGFPVVKHELEQGGIVDGEPDVRGRDRLELSLEVVVRVLDGGSDLVPEAVVAHGGERVEQRLAITEVAAGSSVANLRLAREVAERDLLDPVLPERSLSSGEQRGAQVSVVIRASFRHVRSISEM